MCMSPQGNDRAVFAPARSFFYSGIHPQTTQGGSTLVLSLEKAKPVWWRSVLRVRNAYTNDTNDMLALPLC